MFAPLLVKLRTFWNRLKAPQDSSALDDILLAAVPEHHTIRHPAAVRMLQRYKLRSVFTIFGARTTSASEADTEQWFLELAEDGNTTSNVLQTLSWHISPAVRIAVADNLNSPLPALQRLVEDEHPDVRFALAENHNLEQELLEVLIEDENPYVAHRAQQTLMRVRRGANGCAELNSSPSNDRRRSANG